jgi:thioredoxin-like negative regulator of GroEL|tara:strand:+ start:88 stop:342 length:255 start_codon:yes stop_codon:yes gene_type:complete
MDKGIIYFSAPWCGPCKTMSPMMDALKDQGLPIQKVNIDYDATTVAKYNIKSVPTCVLVDRQMNEIKRKTGLMDQSQLKSWYEG